MNDNDPNQKIIRKKHSPQFKDQALEGAVKDGVPLVANDLGIKLDFSWLNSRGYDSIKNHNVSPTTYVIPNVAKDLLQRTWC